MADALEVMGFTEWTAGTPVAAADENAEKLAVAVALVNVLGEAFGDCIIGQDSFSLTAVSGQLQVLIGPGAAVCGPEGERRPVYFSTSTLLGGLAPCATSYVWLVSGLRRMAFSSGSDAPAIGDTLTGATSGASGILVHAHVASGTWAAGTAAGYLYLRSVSGTFTAGEALDNGVLEDVATCDADPGGTPFDWFAHSDDVADEPPGALLLAEVDTDSSSVTAIRQATAAIRRLASVSTAGPIGAAGTGVTAVEYGHGALRQTVLTVALTGTNAITLADGNHGAGAALYTFPQGVVAVHGCVAQLSVAHNGNFNASPDDVFSAGVGSAAAGDDATLSGTEQDVVAVQTLDTDGGTTSPVLFAGASTGALTLDGASSAAALWLNLACADACNSAAVTFSITGTVTVSWSYLGSY